MVAGIIGALPVFLWPATGAANPSLASLQLLTRLGDLPAMEHLHWIYVFRSCRECWSGEHGSTARDLLQEDDRL